MKCFICNISTGETILSFSEKEDIFKKCQNTLNLRKMKNLKYKDLNLNLNDFNDNGYHLSCYRKFTALSATHRTEFTDWIKTVSK